MSTSATLVLGPVVSPAGTLDTSRPLHLLPFSLGPASAPYASTSSPLATYFQPRPCPPSHPSVAAGTPIAAFRGRQLVGQSIVVPRGYTGVVLGAPKLLGGLPSLGAQGRERGRVAGDPGTGKIPLTPASSVASSTTTEISIDASQEGVRRSPRKSNRGVGQVALSKPKSARAATASRKRFRLDSDDEEEHQEQDVPVETYAVLTRTPSKRARANITAVGTPVKAAVESVPLPSIVVQAATPLKEPISPPRARLPVRPDTDTDFNADADPDHRTDEQSHSVVQVHSTDGPSHSAVQVSEEPILPSPATEDDPPAFSVKDASPAISAPRDEDIPGSADEVQDGAVRVLRPLSTFTEFTLWTPDAPLAGFRTDEQAAGDAALATVAAEAGLVSGGPGAEAGLVGVAAEAEARPTSGGPGDAEGGAENGGIWQRGAGDEDAGVQLGKGWWRTGGAGEGGDEFVRSLGEWLGFVEMLNEPVYLHGVSKADADADSDDE